jgi:hypothetical protein
MQLLKLTFFGLLLGTSLLQTSAQDDEKPNYYKRPENTVQPSVIQTHRSKEKNYCSKRF